MAQTELPFTTAAELHRRRGQHTSRDAARRAVGSGLVPSHETMVSTAVHCLNLRGCTGKEIAAWCQRVYGQRLTNVQVCRRLAALLRRSEIHRRWDPARPGKRLARDGLVIHFPGPPPADEEG